MPEDGSRADQTQCSDLDPNVSWKMNILGATLLHEYLYVTAGPLKFDESQAKFQFTQTLRRPGSQNVWLQDLMARSGSRKQR
jgi:hypothetical protein